jgi:hypothetical protein
MPSYGRSSELPTGQHPSAEAEAVLVRSHALDVAETARSSPGYPYSKTIAQPARRPVALSH